MNALARLADPGAIIFDLDGTLVDTVEARIAAWLAALSKFGIPAIRSQVAPLIGSDGKRLAREMARLIGRELDDDEQERIDHYSGEIFDQLNSQPRPVRGVRPLLLALERSDLAWAIATSSRAAQVDASVTALRLPRPPLIVDGSHVAHAKPAPDLLLLAAHRLHRRPAACWYAGDSTWDMLAAGSAGMIGLGLAYGAVTPADLRSAGARATTSFRSLLADLRRRSLVPMN